MTGVGSVSEGEGVGGVGTDEGVDVDRKARRVGSRSRRGSVEELCSGEGLGSQGQPIICGCRGIQGKTLGGSSKQIIRCGEHKNSLWIRKL